MTTINLKDFYYWYTQDQFIEVSDEVAEVFVSDARHEMVYQRRLSRHKAQYSLDCDDGIEYSACLHEPTPQELLERMELFIRLWNALNSLPESQGRRIDAHIILGKSIKEIAEAPGIVRGAGRRVRCDFFFGRTSEQHQRRNWAGPPSYLRGNAALSMVVFGQDKKMGAAFSILYLHGVRQEGSIAWVLPSCVSPLYAGGVSYF